MKFLNYTFKELKKILLNKIKLVIKSWFLKKLECINIDLLKNIIKIWISLPYYFFIIYLIKINLTKPDIKNLLKTKIIFLTRLLAWLLITLMFTYFLYKILWLSLKILYNILKSRRARSTSEIRKAMAEKDRANRQSDPEDPVQNNYCSKDEEEKKSNSCSNNNYNTWKSRWSPENINKRKESNQKLHPQELKEHTYSAKGDLLSNDSKNLNEQLNESKIKLDYEIHKNLKDNFKFVKDVERFSKTVIQENIKNRSTSPLFKNSYSAVKPLANVILGRVVDSNSDLINKIPSPLKEKLKEASDTKISNKFLEYFKEKSFFETDQNDKIKRKESSYK